MIKRTLVGVVLASLSLLLIGLVTISVQAVDGRLGKPDEDCRMVVMSDYGSGYVINEKWDPAPSGMACLLVEWEKSGSVLMAGGVFTAPLTLNGEVIPTRWVGGQLAPQIIQFRRSVGGVESWEFRPTWLETGTELYLGFDYESVPPIPTPTPIPPSVRGVYLPYIEKSPTVLEEVRSVGLVAELQLFQASWPQAVGGQITCLRLDFQSEGDAYLESGWFFGESLSATLNDVSLVIPTFEVPGQAAKQMGSVVLPEVETLRVCTVGTGSGNEIGLRIRFPYNP